MHISVFHHRSHLLARGLHFLVQHKLGISFTAFMVFLMLVTYVSQRAMVNHQSLVSGIAVGSSGIVRPLTRLDDPQYVHEHERRAQDILTHLDTLKDQTQADRAYAVSYIDGLNRFGKMVKISKTFEIGQIDELNPVSHYQDFSRMSWLYFRQYQTMISGLYPPDEFPQGYGTELYDLDGNAIGYLGIDYRQGFPMSQVNEMKLLRHAATAIKTSLLQPLEHVNSEE